MNLVLPAFTAKADAHGVRSREHLGFEHALPARDAITPLAWLSLPRTGFQTSVLSSKGQSSSASDRQFTADSRALSTADVRRVRGSTTRTLTTPPIAAADHGVAM